MAKVMKADLLVTHIGQLVTCASGGKPKRGGEMLECGIVNDGAVAISKGKFIGIGRTAEIVSKFKAKEVIDATGRAACPGFVDPHTHVVFAGDRLDEFELKIKGADYLQILEDGGGILSTVAATRNAAVKELVELGLQRLDRMIAAGTTTCEIKTGYGLDTENELKMLQVIEELDKAHAIEIVPTFLAAHAVPLEFKGNTEGFVDLVCGEMLPRAWDWYVSSQFFKRKVPFFADVFCEKNAFSAVESKRVLKTAKALWFGLKAHVDQFNNLGGSRLAIELGAVSIDHLDAISAREVKLLAGSDTVGVLTPTVNFNSGSAQFADARKLIDSGCLVALSTDCNPGSAPCPSQQMAMAIACRYQKLVPAEALNAATINAAFAIGLGESHGSIEVGKNADLLILDTRDYRDAAYQFGGNQARIVVKSGHPQ